ncbi:hypothetical protein EVAR_36891_1 [Eumeta japonica]|uniref:Uncharacterized protein n=1 Tax=Eumeta variegata TaxID=151549 RepID=A0A4C1WRJ9_EUMVA|nr:hypothetical protein EVAR_36891_1 [Eumeta japonica]
MNAKRVNYLCLAAGGGRRAADGGRPAREPRLTSSISLISSEAGGALQKALKTSPVIQLGRACGVGARPRPPRAAVIRYGALLQRRYSQYPPNCALPILFMARWKF